MWTVAWKRALTIGKFIRCRVMIRCLHTMRQVSVGSIGGAGGHDPLLAWCIWKDLTSHLLCNEKAAHVIFSIVA